MYDSLFNKQVAPSEAPIPNCQEHNLARCLPAETTLGQRCVDRRRLDFLTISFRKRSGY
jgi:hypothetical protein